MLLKCKPKLLSEKNISVNKHFIKLVVSSTPEVEITTQAESGT
jgi:hypothetical protein